METCEKKSGTSPGKRIRAHFITGIILVAPVGVTVWIFVWIFTTIDNILQPIIRHFWGQAIPGVGFVITIVLVYIVGLTASNVVGKRLVRYGDSLLCKVPIFRQVYVGIRQIAESFSTPEKSRFMNVVLVEFPNKGMWAIGFVTNELAGKTGEKLLSIYIPTAPTPTGGFLQIVREDEVVRTGMSVDDALKMIISAGSVTPREVGGKIPGV